MGGACVGLAGAAAKPRAVCDSSAGCDADQELDMTKRCAADPCTTAADKDTCCKAKAKLATEKPAANIEEAEDSNIPELDAAANPRPCALLAAPFVLFAALA